MKPGSSSDAPSAKSAYSDFGPIRILRAVEGEGESVKTEDFEVCPSRSIVATVISLATRLGLLQATTLNDLGSCRVSHGFRSFGTDE